MSIIQLNIRVLRSMHKLLSRYIRFIIKIIWNNANLGDLIAATGLIIIIKLDLNRRLFSLCDLDIWWMTSKNNRASLLYYIKLCASFEIHRSIQTGVQKRPIRVKSVIILFHVTLKFDRWPCKTIGHFYATSSFVHHFKAIDKSKLKLQPGNTQFGSKSAICVPCDLKIWRMTLINNRALLLSYSKPCASFRSHWGIQTGVTVPKLPIWFKIDDSFIHVTLKFDGWPWKTIGHRKQHQALCIISPS